MGRILKLAGLVLVAVLIILQFFQPERDRSVIDPGVDMLEVLIPPERIAELMRNACYDCHSNQTRYPWYDRISPVSWFLNKHIKKGKEELNFSDYGRLNKSARIGIFADLCDVMDGGSMPLKSYKLLHKDARLGQEEREMLCIWSEEEAMKVMRE